MTKTMLILLVVGFFILLYYGFRKLDRKLEALVRLNNKKRKGER
jgi:arginine exporter protein ArgO